VFWVYVLECRDGTLYTGYTADLARRLRCHARGRASRYTRSRLPVRPVYWEAVASREEALRLEAALKRLSREQKLRYIVSRRQGDESEPVGDEGSCPSPWV
jgi:putative endonuclease